MSERGVRVKVLGRSGGLRLVRESGKRRDISKNDGVLVVEIDYIKQKNEQGRDVGNDAKYVRPCQKMQNYTRVLS